MNGRRSSRSVRTGPGSRGGQWHDPEYRRAWFRAYRLAHPDYRARDNSRRLLSHNLERLAGVVGTHHHPGDDDPH